ncbi:hypothetical protein [Brevundimonas sp.]|jgi:hypothetical protein|uniref:hypothetical protein n=1 Tax=Brevundimonas sp. TaxID=1871086 RepID=UPI002E158890
MHTRNIFLACAALTAASCATAPDAQLEAIDIPEEMAVESQALVQTAAYTATPDTYVYLSVEMDFGGANGKRLQLCPERGAGIDWRNFLQGDRRATVGFSVTGPDGGAPIRFEPFVIDSKDAWGRRDCTTEFYRESYRSPLHLVRVGDSRAFQVRTASTSRIQPTASTVDLLSRAGRLIVGASSTTAPFAERASEELKTQLQTTGTLTSHTDGGPLRLDGSTTLAPIKHEIVFRRTTVSVTITPRLVQRASLFVQGATFPTTGAVAPRADAILSTTIIPSSEGQSARTVAGFLNDEARPALDQIRAAGDAGALNNPCQVIAGELTGKGLTSVDQALILWAVISENASRSLTAAVRDQTGCLQSRKDLLKRAGVTLSDPPAEPEPDPIQPASKADFAAAIAPLPEDAEETSYDKLVLFLKMRPGLDSIARTLFHYPLTVSDPDGRIVRSGTSKLEHPDSWMARWAATPGAAPFTNFGCHRYHDAPARPGMVRSTARATFADGFQDYEVRMTYARVNGETRITGMEVLRIPNLEGEFRCRDYPALVQAP